MKFLLKNLLLAALIISAQSLYAQRVGGPAPGIGQTQLGTNFSNQCPDKWLSFHFWGTIFQSQWPSDLPCDLQPHSILRRRRIPDIQIDDPGLQVELYTMCAYSYDRFEQLENDDPEWFEHFLAQRGQEACAGQPNMCPSSSDFQCGFSGVFRERPDGTQETIHRPVFLPQNCWIELTPGAGGSCQLEVWYRDDQDTYADCSGGCWY